MCIFHYFNYYLPYFVTAICIGFFFLFFLSFPLNIFASTVFIALFPTWHFALVCFPVCALVSFVLVDINFWFPLFSRSIHCTLILLDCFDFAYGYMCIFHYFNYYLPDFVTAICLGFMFGFSFLNSFNIT